MKILTYNINGLKSFYKKGLLDKLFDDFFDVDVFCFQEVKADYKTVTKILDKYSDYNWYYSENTIKSGYAGTLTMWKDDKFFHFANIGLPKNSNIEFDSSLEQYWDGRSVFTNFYNFDINFNLVNVYVPNSGKKELLREAFDESLLYNLTTIKSDIPTIIVGDMNVCSTELDYWGNYEKSLDTCPGLMRFEINGFHKLLEAGFVDVYRELNKDNRKYSYYPTIVKNSVENNKGWRLDYVLIDKEHKDIVKSVEIFSGYNGADHSPVVVDIKIS